MNIFKKKSNDPTILIKEKVDILIKKFSSDNVPYILQGHHKNPEDIEEFENYIRTNLLECYLSEDDKNVCMNNYIEFSTMRYHNILKTISKGLGEFIKHKGQPSASDLVAKAYSITAWDLFGKFYNDIL